jgi:geranylgeranyl reductase family
MSADPMYDFAVIGVGPAGARFAQQAAARGHRVIAFEQGEIGTPLACSGHVSTDIYHYLPPGAAGVLRQNEISAAHFHVGGPDTPGHRFYRDETISVVIDRVGLDRVLADAAADAGADVRTHHTVTAVQPSQHHVDVEVQAPDGPSQFRARMVVGADGPTSRTRDALGIEPPGELLHGVLGFDPIPDAAGHVDVHLIVPGFFAWRIPRGQAGVEYGIAGSPGPQLRDRFQRFLASYDVSLTDRCSGAIPIGPPPRRWLIVGWWWVMQPRRRSRSQVEASSTACRRRISPQRRSIRRTPEPCSGTNVDGGVHSLARSVSVPGSGGRTTSPPHCSRSDCGCWQVSSACTWTVHPVCSPDDSSVGYSVCDGACPDRGRRPDGCEPSVNGRLATVTGSPSTATVAPAPTWSRATIPSPRQSVPPVC